MPLETVAERVTLSGVASTSRRSWIVTRRAFIDSVMVNAMSVIPSGPKMCSFIAWPRRWPRCCSTMRPSQSMLTPYVQRAPGSCSSTVRIDANVHEMTLGMFRAVRYRRSSALKNS